jgi:hypothetical protein
MGIDWDTPTSLQQIQQFAFESFFCLRRVFPQSVAKSFLKPLSCLGKRFLTQV